MSKRNPNRSRDNNILIGVIVMIIGFGLLIREMDFIFFPYWIFSFPTLLIVIGILVGVRRQFQGIGWIVLVLVGSFFLVADLPGMHWIHDYKIPIGVIVVGLVLIFRAALTRSITESDTNRYQASSNLSVGAENTSADGNSDDVINVSTIFGNTKKKILTKNFKGGQSTVLFGGTELDLTHADINGVAVVDGMVAFGGLEIVVPSNWDVQSEMSVILGGIEDKRSRLSDVDPTKRLILKGTCMFGGVEIKSY